MHHQYDTSVPQLAVVTAVIGSERFATAFASGADTSDPEQYRRTMMKAAGPDLGFALVFLSPGSKDSFICPLSARQTKTADEAQRERTGNPRATHRCGRYHAFTDSQTVGQFLRKRIDAGLEMPNVSVEIGQSKMLVVDLDTDAEVEAFTRSWAATYPDTPVPPLTVSSPGQVNRRGEWVHKNGGHLWVDATPLGSDPDLAALAPLLDQGDGTVKHPDGWTLFYRDRIVLVPPSVRSEGPYEFMSSALPVTRAGSLLLPMIANDAKARARRVAEREQRRAAAVDRDSSKMIAWSAHTNWPDQLSPAGWIDTGKPDSCGCPIWTAPGDHASPKSATAHEDGCSYTYDADEGHLPLHIWTDNPPDYLPPGRDTFTLFQHQAWRDHGGDFSTAARVSGLSTANLALAPLEEPAELPAPTPVPAAVPALGELGTPETGDRDDPVPASPGLQAVTEDNAEALADADAMSREQRHRALMLADRVEDLRLRQEAAAILAAENRPPYRRMSIKELVAMPEPEPLIEGIYHADSLSRVVGSSYSGKSFVVLDQMFHVALGRDWAGHKVAQSKVLYVFAEGKAATARRTQNWCRRHGVSLDEIESRVDIVPDAVSLTPAGVADLVADVTEQGYGMVVFDTQHSMLEGDENSAADLKVMRDALDAVRNTPSGPCVILIHHTGHENARGRGSSSGTAMLDTEILVTQDGDGIVEATVTKDKLGQEGARTLMRIVDVEGKGTGVIESMDPLAPETVEMLAIKPDPNEELPEVVYTGSSVSVKAKRSIARFMRESRAVDTADLGQTHAHAYRAHLDHTDKRDQVSRTRHHLAWQELQGANWLIPATEGNPHENPAGAMVWNRDRDRG